jgi:hypothetical protein
MSERLPTANPQPATRNPQLVTCNPYPRSRIGFSRVLGVPGIRDAVSVNRR